MQPRRQPGEQRAQLMGRPTGGTSVDKIFRWPKCWTATDQSRPPRCATGGRGWSGMRRGRPFCRSRLPRPTGPDSGVLTLGNTPRAFRVYFTQKRHDLTGSIYSGDFRVPLPLACDATYATVRFHHYLWGRGFVALMPVTRMAGWPPRDRKYVDQGRGRPRPLRRLRTR
ncbi:hypothetical protein FRAHR75_390067 [Frankia sp. Hr75.2]|nr:hypothetical protein FRAHR75_390067 [Frankia sp. Hr75.2]SQD96691.1 hypothetical protein FMEAI12_3740006 [Parafrankia sp. Ea1.12]